MNHSLNLFVTVNLNSCSVVFAGFSAESLRTRIVDGKCVHVQALVAQSVSAFGC